MAKYSDQRSPFFFSWDWQKLFVDPTPVEKFVSQVVTWPAATRVFLPATYGGKGMRAWEWSWSATAEVSRNAINRYRALQNTVKIFAKVSLTFLEFCFLISKLSFNKSFQIRQKLNAWSVNQCNAMEFFWNLIFKKDAEACARKQKAAVKLKRVKLFQ